MKDIEAEERLRADVRAKMYEEKHGWKKPILVIAIVMIVIGMAMQIFSGGKVTFFP